MSDTTPVEQLDRGQDIKIADSSREPGFRAEVEHLSGQRLPDCYQCGECTSGCPVAFAMDYTPNQISRMVQLEMADEILSSSAIWLCAGCETCATRCPKNVEISKVTDALRQIALKRKIHSPERDVEEFHKAFLNSVERNGRVHEMGMIIAHKMKTRKFFKDVPVGLGLFFKGKLSPFAGGIKDRDSVRKIFEDARRRRENGDER